MPFDPSDGLNRPPPPPSAPTALETALCGACAGDRAGDEGMGCPKQTESVAVSDLLAIP